MDQFELQVAPWDIACSPGWLYMSATAEGTAINRELRELERQATETLSLEPVLTCCRLARADARVAVANHFSGLAPGPD